MYIEGVRNKLSYKNSKGFEDRIRKAFMNMNIELHRFQWVFTELLSNCYVSEVALLLDVNYENKSLSGYNYVINMIMNILFIL